MTTIRALVAAALAFALAIPFAASAGPVDATVAAAPGAWITGYATPVAVVTQGAALAFLNGDVLRHNVVSTDAGPDDNAWCDGFRAGGCPLFWSPLVGLAAEVAVDGVPGLAPGTYAFYCTLHPNMLGWLKVVPRIA